jgi:hypothetical protein
MKKFLFALVFACSCTGPENEILMEGDWIVPPLADLVRESIPDRGWIPVDWVYTEFEGVPREDIHEALLTLRDEGLYVGDKVFWQ